MQTHSHIRFSALGRRAEPPTIARLMAMTLENPQLLSLAAGFTDNSTLPAKGVQKAVAELVARSGEPEYLQYGSNHGRPELRRLLTDHLCEQEPSLDPLEVQRGFFVTNGSQQALYLAMQVLCEPGDIVLVDRPTYFVFLEMLKGLGIEARSIPVDAASGLVDAPAMADMLRAMRSRGELARVRAVYFVSYYSNPSGRSLERSEKALIANTLRDAGLIIPAIEDAAYRDLFYEQPHAAPSVLSMTEWGEFPRFYTSTLTKPYATGLKVGFGTCTDPEWRAKMLHVKAHHDFGSANFNQALFECVLGDGGFAEQLKVIRPAYRAKMLILDDALHEAGLSEHGWNWRQPEGGLYIWLRAPDHVDTGLDSRLCHECVEAGVLYVPGELCFGDDVPKNCIRLSFGVLTEGPLREAAHRFAAVARRYSS